MGYLLRVFAKSDATVPVAELSAGFDEPGWDAVVECDAGRENNWTAIRIAHANGNDICFVTRDDVTPGSLGRREADSFIEALTNYLPLSGAEWVGAFLAQVRVIYAVKVQTSAEDDPTGWMVMQQVINVLRNDLDGLTHAEAEGFYITDDGYLVAAAPGFEWVAPDSVLVAAVRRGDGWVAFVATPDNGTFSAFQRGEVPDGVEHWPVT